jgi:hypothetical protein
VKTITRSSQSRTYYVSKLWLSVATATVVFLISVGALLFTLRPLSRFQSKYFVRVVDAATNAPISNGEVELSFGAAPQRMITDFNGTATFVLSDKEIGKTGTVRAEFYGYEPQQQPFDVTRHGNRTIFLPLTRETKPRDAQPPSSFAQVFSSGMVRTAHTHSLEIASVMPGQNADGVTEPHRRSRSTFAFKVIVNILLPAWG